MQRLAELGNRCFVDGDRVHRSSNGNTSAVSPTSAGALHVCRREVRGWSWRESGGFEGDDDVICCSTRSGESPLTTWIKAAGRLPSGSCCARRARGGPEDACETGQCDRKSYAAQGRPEGGAAPRADRQGEGAEADGCAAEDRGRSPQQAVEEACSGAVPLERMAFRVFFLLLVEVAAGVSGFLGDISQSGQTTALAVSSFQPVLAEATRAGSRSQSRWISGAL